MKNSSREYFINNGDISANGNNALFHANHHNNILNMLLYTNINYKHINNDNENVLLRYCCKNGQKDNSVKSFIKKLDIDPNMINNIGKNRSPVFGRK
ncbi:hypothetical protein PIROE2DRAFT_18731 [Piromyces sp. E2]|nr:hypothetical protein PIROE2DRAFT_18731 [Piromyces sp. E2]|eukprot:OUM56594.1 hypothetical protein PIROE2DRAFT_18731 [Piromyces sp. E2]